MTASTSNVSPVSALVNAENTLVSAVVATTERVRQVATTALPGALAELHNEIEQAKARIQAAAMLYRADLSSLASEIEGFAVGIFADLASIAQPEPLPAPVVEEASPISLPHPLPVPPVVVAEDKEPEAKEEEVTVSMAANHPSKEPVASPLVALQSTQEGETESTPSFPSRKPSKGKGRAAKGKPTRKAK